MTVQITIIGLGQIGASFGLALQSRQEQLKRVGHDKELSIARQAEKIKAVDRVEANLHRAVHEADLVLLCLPVGQLHETMQLIAEDLKEGAVVMDTGPAKEMASAWAAELFPAGRYYIGLTPVINPNYLHASQSGIEAARPDLFQDGLMAIVAPHQTESAAIKLASDLTNLVGAKPLFADPVEMDGLMSATHLLPQLMAAALLDVTVDRPGWREGRKVAGRAYAEASAPMAHLANEPESLGASSILNRDNLLRLLDSAIVSLEAMRDDIDAKDQTALNERLKRARAGREIWWAERQTGNWGDGEAEAVIPETPGVFGRMFGIGKNPKTKSK
jgi:prephenate dehydrogenase